MKKKTKQRKVSRKPAGKSSLFSSINGHPVNNHPLFTYLFYFITAAFILAALGFLIK